MDLREPQFFLAPGAVAIVEMKKPADRLEIDEMICGCRPFPDGSDERFGSRDLSPAAQEANGIEQVVGMVVQPCGECVGDVRVPVQGAQSCVLMHRRFPFSMRGLDMSRVKNPLHGVVSRILVRSPL